VLQPGAVFAGYTVEKLLGKGGMGAVYLARHPRLPRRTALKLLNREAFADQELRARFEREGELVARLDHPNIVAVYDRGLEDEQLWIAMQYVDGVDASSLDARTLPPPRAAQIVAETAAALDYAHRMGVLHRDVKPANIMLSRAAGQERVFLTDFGIARPQEDTAHLTRTGTVTATLAYASPEQLTGGHMDHRTDQYALACTLFWLLTGRVPFHATQPVAVIHGHLREQPPALSSVRVGMPPALDAVLNRALSKHIEERYDSCGEFAAAVRQAMGLPAPGAPRAGYPSAPSVPHASTPPGGPFAAAPSAGPHGPGAAFAGQAPVPPAGHHAPGAPVGHRALGSAGQPGPVASNPAMSTPPHAGLRPGPQPFAAPVGRAHQAGRGWSAASGRPAPGGPAPRRRSGAAVPLIILLVLLLIIAGVGVWAWNSDAVRSLTGRSDGHKDLAALHDAFPRMVPAGADSGDGYDGARCFAYARYLDFLDSTGYEEVFDPWQARWSCIGGFDSAVSYRFYSYPSPAQAHGTVEALAVRGTEYGSETIGSRTDRTFVAESEAGVEYAVLVSTYLESGRDRWVLVFERMGGADELEALVQAVRAAPL